jgi:hypothetical protein
MKRSGIFIVLAFVVSTMFGQTIKDSSKILFGQYNSLLFRFDLDTIQGKITALYNKPYEVRANAVHRLLSDCSAFYNEQFPDVIFNPQVLILDSQSWNMIARTIPNSLPVYGLPDAEPKVNKIFIAADKKAVAELFGLKDDLPDSVLSEFDYIALHELGHIFLERYEKTFTHWQWADEFLASYFAICYLKQVNDTLGLPQLDQTGYQPKYKSLVYFDSLYEGVGPANYAWYQGKFQKLATQLYPLFKLKMLKIFISNYSVNGKKEDPLEFLKHLSPSITDSWAEEMKQVSNN